MRTFEGGATRDSEEDKLDYEGFLSHPVMQRYAQYMHLHRKQPDGDLRDSDNWQKGMPKSVYMKSMFRHFMDVWYLHRRGLPIQEALCALLFNVMGYLFMDLQEKKEDVAPGGPAPGTVIPFRRFVPLGTGAGPLAPIHDMTREGDGT